MSNCGDTKSKTYVDYKDGSMLCLKCYKKLKDEWRTRDLFVLGGGVGLIFDFMEWIGRSIRNLFPKKKSKK